MAQIDPLAQAHDDRHCRAGRTIDRLQKIVTLQDTLAGELLREYRSAMVDAQNAERLAACRLIDALDAQEKQSQELGLVRQTALELEIENNRLRQDNQALRKQLEPPELEIVPPVRAVHPTHDETRAWECLAG